MLRYRIIVLLLAVIVPFLFAILAGVIINGGLNAYDWVMSHPMEKELLKDIGVGILLAICAWVGGAIIFYGACYIPWLGIGGRLEKFVIWVEGLWDKRPPEPVVRADDYSID